MRDILFRAKRLDNNEWIYGCFFHQQQMNSNKELELVYFMMDASRKLHEIDINTLGQYTGVRDKYETMIFEGDIVEGMCYIFAAPEVLKLTIYYNTKTGGFQLDVFDWNTLVVVGNKYETEEK